ncbi:hypothetical protein TBLA_0H03170 [Henningerozyma blattae CBS 6284]|uniref:Calcineurin-like phosphoesterase domain-containing protein n=1 Tax=Henningerozyma blattae (strain ATCC 34711 / CBS 6284 / DSM 70876 / NBRC 10599 / NRRL Y-10934 / UCD 77-7) TaxID=1071380 RepID=I2H896_HENB6|nr:hypothetical protein TBLA_0H03170 [Tetrapisispora blattae CBS 6284]CCH62598.1 hypothetical protein TBLA_0H03170 [Tetrapisispora blattae CBS 6284]
MSSRKGKKFLPKTKSEAELIESKGHVINKMPHLKNNGKWKIYWRHLFLMVIFWILLIHYYERVVVKRAMKLCMWNKWENWPKEAESFKVGLFADPQIMDNHSYPGRPEVVNFFTRSILDNYHRRNWKYVQFWLDPDASLFLGDLFDGGRYWEDEYWHEEYKRFNEIFPKKAGRKSIMSLPGNHDIGFGDTVIEKSFKRFTTYFGDTSSYTNLGNHTFVLIDTIALSDKANKNISDIPKEFLHQFSKTHHPLPKIMLTHVPLYRDPKVQVCGKLRESPKLFPMLKGDQYQTVIDYDISQNILSTVQPRYLFSGDDHDYCHINHTYATPDGIVKTADEITVKSCAMNMGISKPAIQLLSLYNPTLNESPNIETIQTNICYLPDPYKPIKMYVITLLITVGLVIYINIFPRKFNDNVVTRLERLREKRLAQTVNCFQCHWVPYVLPIQRLLDLITMFKNGFPLLVYL